MAGSTEFRNGLKQNQHLFAQIDFRLLRYRRENSQRKGSTSILENDILGLSAQPADRLAGHDVLRKFLPPRLLHDRSAYCGLSLHHLRGCIRVHDPF